MADREALTRESQRSGRQLNVVLSVEADARLRELAGGAGMKPTTLAVALLEELLPTVTGVRQRLQITRRQENGRG